MSTYNQWLFEAPSGQASSYHTNLEYETSFENEWEMSSDNYENFSLTEEEWEANTVRRPVSRTRQPGRRPSRPAKRTARIPRRRPTPSRRQQRAPVAQRQLRQPTSSPQTQGTAAAPRILIATIDRFEFGSYLLKRHQFEQLQDLTMRLIANKDLGTQVKLTFVGHTDNVGGEKAGNWHLAGRRAMEVENHIMRTMRNFSEENDLAFNLVSSIGGEGPRKPIAPNTTKDGQARNRRVEVFSDVPLKPAS